MRRENKRKHIPTLAVLVFLLLALPLLLSGCGGRTMDDIIAHDPSVMGVVTEIADSSVLIENETGAYRVSREPQNGDSYTDFRPGDEIVVYYTGDVSEGSSPDSPKQIDTVTGITLRTQADRRGE